MAEGDRGRVERPAELTINGATIHREVPRDISPLKVDRVQVQQGPFDLKRKGAETMANSPHLGIRLAAAMTWEIYED